MFSSLQEREKILLIVAAAVMVVMAVYLYVWQPMNTRLKELRSVEVPESASTLAWMQQAIAVAGDNIGKKKAKKIGGPLLTVIEQTADQSRIKAQMSRIQPAGDGKTVRVWFDNVVFDDWLLWVDRIKAQGIKVVSSGVAPEETSGRVTVRVTVGR